MERRACAGRRPQSFALPSRFGIVDAAIQPFGVKTQRIRHAEVDELSVNQGKQGIIQIAGGDRNVLA